MVRLAGYPRPSPDPASLLNGTRGRGVWVRKATAKLRRAVGRLDPSREVTLPPGTRLDARPDLRQYDIGRFSWGHVTVSNRSPGARFSMGQFCSLAYGCHVLLGGEHRADFVSTYRFPAYEPFREAFSDPGLETSTSRGDVLIGNDVWIGHQSLIMSGVEVGDGAVVGAGSVVRRSVPPYAIVAGNPARVLGFRFPPEQIEALLRIRWWDWPVEKIMEHLPLLASHDVQAFIDACEPPAPA